MKQTFLKTMLLFFITISFTNCDKEDNSEVELTEIQKIQSKFSLENFENPFVKNNLLIDWNDFNTNQNKEDKSVTYEFNTSFKVSNSLSSGKQKLSTKYRLLTSKNDLDTWEYELIKFLSNKTKLADDISYFKPAFSGTLYHYNLKGKTLKIKAYKKGELVNEFSDINANSLFSKSQAIDGDGSGGYQEVCTTNYVDWYQLIDGVYEYTHSVNKGTTCEFIWIESGSGGTGGINTNLHNHYNGPHGTNGNSNNHNNEVLFDDDIGIFIYTSGIPKIADLKKELECFDKSNPAKLTIYVEQAIENSREVTARLGHTFIGLEQNGVVRNLGFYPLNNTAVVKNVDSEIHDNSNSPYHISISIGISANQLKNIITYIEDYPSKYNLNEYNCSDFGIAISERAGINLPKTVGTYSFFGKEFFKGRNPSDLGEDMRGITLPTGATRDLDGGNAPERSADCQ